jgi:hypothetical protein
VISARAVLWPVTRIVSIFYSGKTVTRTYPIVLFANLNGDRGLRQQIATNRRHNCMTCPRLLAFLFLGFWLPAPQ